MDGLQVLKTAHAQLFLFSRCSAARTPAAGINDRPVYRDVPRGHAPTPSLSSLHNPSSPRRAGWGAASTSRSRAGGQPVGRRL